MLGEVREVKGEEWQEEEGKVQPEEGEGKVWQEEVGLEGEGGEESQEEGEVPGVREGILSPVPFHGRLQTLIQTVHPYLLHSVRPLAHRLFFPAIPTQSIFCPPSWMRTFLDISWMRPTGNYREEYYYA